MIKTDTLIIGGGISGVSTARELSRYDAKVILVEKENDVCAGTTKANSAIVHAGYDAESGTKKAYYNVRGNKLIKELSKELDFSLKENGSMVVTYEEEGLSKLEALMERGKANGVGGMKILKGAEILEEEPGLNPDIKYALLAKEGAIVCPFEMTYALAENAATNGVEFRLNECVNSITPCEGGYTVKTNKETYEARTVVNAAGVFADSIHNMVCDRKLKIVPRRGEYCLMDRTESGIISHTIFNLPSKLGKGILVTPSVHGNVLAGPTASDQEDKSSVATSKDGLDEVLKNAGKNVPKLNLRNIITSFAGLRAHLVGEGEGDFYIGESADSFYDIAGIESPGLSSAPAIGVDIAGMIAEKLSLKKKDNFVSTRVGIKKINEATPDECDEMIAQKPLYANVVCRCEMISEEEIIEAIRRVPGATDLDGVKRRVRAGMGRCQSGFCQIKIMEILSRELGMDKDKLTKRGGESKVLEGYIKA